MLHQRLEAPVSVGDAFCFRDSHDLDVLGKTMRASEVRKNASLMGESRLLIFGEFKNDEWTRFVSGMELSCLSFPSVAGVLT